MLREASACDRFWARLHEIGTLPSGACHSGRKQLQSVFLGPFLENNGPVWHSRRPVGPFWLTFGGVWAFLETRPAGTPHLQTQNGPPLATKALKLANHQPIWPPAHGKTPWGLPTPIARHLVWPPNLAGWTLCTFHSSFPSRVPPCGAGTPCPGTKMAKPIKTLRHHIVGGQLGCGLGLWATTWQV